MNWIIAVLAAVVIVFLLSLVWRIVLHNRGTRTESEPFTQRSEPLREIVRVEVLNGCGVGGIAAKFTDYLRDQGFDVVNTDNYRNFDVDSSFIIDRRSMRRIYGNKLAETLGISPHRVEPILNEALELEATLVVGKDYRSLKGSPRSGGME